MHFFGKKPKTCGTAVAIPPRMTIKTCGCGLEYSKETWAALPLKGIQDLGDGETLVLKNCQCSSTLALPEEK
jgi:hypothetical protein